MKSFPGHDLDIEPEMYRDPDSDPEERAGRGSSLGSLDLEEEICPYCESKVSSLGYEGPDEYSHGRAWYYCPKCKKTYDRIREEPRTPTEYRRIRDLVPRRRKRRV